MLLFCHLFAGVIIGILISWYIHDRRAVIAGIAGAILPDIIDKPLGHIFLFNSLDNGRIIGHTLLSLVIIIVIVSVLITTRKALYLLALPLGVLSHDLLDMMWNDPVSWAFPLLGPFHHGVFENYISNMFLVEITSVSELLFATASLVLLLLYIPTPWKFRKFIEGNRFHSVVVSGFFFSVPCFLLVCGFNSLIAGIFQISSPWYPRGLPFENYAMAVTALMGVVIFSLSYLKKDLNPFKLM